MNPSGFFSLYSILPTQTQCYPFWRTSFLTSSQSGSGLLFLRFRLVLRIALVKLCFPISGIGQLTPAASAGAGILHRTVGYLHAPAIALLESFTSYFSRSSLIFRTLAPHCIWCSAGVVNRSWVMSYLLVSWGDSMPYFLINQRFPFLLLRKTVRLTPDSLCDITGFAVRLVPESLCSLFGFCNFFFVSSPWLLSERIFNI